MVTFSPAPLLAKDGVRVKIIEATQLRVFNGVFLFVRSCLIKPFVHLHVRQIGTSFLRSSYHYFFKNITYINIYKRALCDTYFNILKCCMVPENVAKMYVKGKPLSKNPPQKVPQTILASFLTPQNQANAHLNLDNSPLNKCPKPSWQAF